MKKILFPTDFSEAAENAFVYALRLADKTGAEIVTFHSYTVPNLETGRLPVTITEIYESINLEEFEDYKDSVPRLREIAEKQGLSHIKVSHVMESGEAIPSIVKMAKKEAADLIIMGTKGASGMKEIFIGSVAAEVMEYAPCPVLGIPIEANFDGRLNRIAMTTEFKEEEKKALGFLAKWAAPFESDIYCIHVDLKHIEFLAYRMNKMKEEFPDQRNIHFEVIDSTDLEIGISNFLFENKIDVLAMVIHRRNFFKELFSYSQTKKIAYHFSVPILALPEKMFK